MNNWETQNRYQQPNNWQPQYGGALQTPSAAQAQLSERLTFIRKVYGLLFIAILFAIGGVAAALAFPPLLMAVAQHPLIAFLALIGGILGAQAVRHVPGLNLLAFFGFTALTGVVISPLIYLLLRENPNSITQAGLMTVGIFGSLTAYVFISKKDFSFLRGMLFTGLIVLVLFGVLNIFLGSGGLGFALAAVALLLFSGYILYDTSNILHRYPTNEHVVAALSLYLDVWNIFLALLRILNSGRR